MRNNDTTSSCIVRSITIKKESTLTAVAITVVTASPSFLNLRRTYQVTPQRCHSINANIVDILAPFLFQCWFVDIFQHPSNLCGHPDNDVGIMYQCRILNLNAWTTLWQCCYNVINTGAQHWNLTYLQCSSNINWVSDGVNLETWTNVVWTLCECW